MGFNSKDVGSESFGCAIAADLVLVGARRLADLRDSIVSQMPWGSVELPVTLLTSAMSPGSVPDADMLPSRQVDCVGRLVWRLLARLSVGITSILVLRRRHQNSLVVARAMRETCAFVSAAFFAALCSRAKATVMPRARFKHKPMYCEGMESDPAPELAVSRARGGWYQSVLPHTVHRSSRPRNRVKVVGIGGVIVGNCASRTVNVRS